MNADGIDDRLLRAADVAQILSVSRANAYALMAAGRIPSLRIGRCLRTPKGALLHWIVKQTDGQADLQAGRTPERSHK